MIARSSLSLATALFLGACFDTTTSSTASAGGTLVISVNSDPKILFPPLIISVPARQAAESIYDYLLVVGPEMRAFRDADFRPRLAESWKWAPDSLSIAFRINPKAHWHDGPRADASDVRYTWQVYTSSQLASPAAEELSDIDSVTVGDSLTAVFWYKRRSPHQLLDASQMLILPRHIFEKIPMDSLREAGVQLDPVGTGRFRLRRWSRESYLEIAADTGNYRGRPGLDRVIWSVAPDHQTASAKLFGGDADLSSLRPEQLAEIPRHPELRVVSLPGMVYVFMGFNLHDPRSSGRPHPLFGSRDLRRALTMAIDRASLVKNVYDTLAGVGIGPTVRAFPTTDERALRQIPFDPRRAEAILDSLGWVRSGSDSIRKRAGKELAFEALVSASAQPRIRMAVLIQEQLRRIGVRMRIGQMEMNTVRSRFASRDFDAILWDWQFGAIPNQVREMWGTASARKKDGHNGWGYKNSAFDAHVDSAIAATNPDDARRHYAAAYQVIIDDAPAVWLYEPKTVLGLNRRIRTGQMRPDAWWIDLGSWFVPKSEQIARDRIASGS